MGKNKKKKNIPEEKKRDRKNEKLWQEQNKKLRVHLGRETGSGQLGNYLADFFWQPETVRIFWSSTRGQFFIGTFCSYIIVYGHQLYTHWLCLNLLMFAISVQRFETKRNVLI